MIDVYRFFPDSDVEGRFTSAQAIEIEQRMLLPATANAQCLSDMARDFSRGQSGPKQWSTVLPERYIG